MLAKPSIVIINGINNLGLEIANKLGNSSNVLVVGKNLQGAGINFPKHISTVDYDLFPSVKLSTIKNIIILHHEKTEDLVSANDLVNNAKFLSDIFNIANANKARIIITTSYAASKQHVFAKYVDKDNPYDFPSLQNFIEKLTLEQNRKNPAAIIRLGDVYGTGMNSGIIYRMVKDAVSNNYVKVDEDGLDRIYPVSYKQIADSIHKAINAEHFKGGVFTLSPIEGMTQMSFANMCMQYSSNISYIKFVKSKYKTSSSEPMYENMYSPAPYLTENFDDSNIEKDLLFLVKSINPQKTETLKTEKEVPISKRTHKESLSKIEERAQQKLTRYVISFVIFFTLLFFAVIPPCFTIVNTKLLASGNKVFINNYNNSNTSELSEDIKYNKEKATNILGSIILAQWMLPFFGDNYKDNQKYLNAQEDYFEALGYSKDYKFTQINEASRSIIQIKLQSAKSAIDSVDKSKLFWDLENNFDDMKSIIDESNLE